MAAVKASRVVVSPSAVTLPVRTRIRVSATVEPPPLRANSISIVPRARHGARIVHATLQALPDRLPPRAGRPPSDESVREHGVRDGLADGMAKARQYLAHRNLDFQMKMQMLFLNLLHLSPTLIVLVLFASLLHLLVNTLWKKKK
jgi:hypothetical protein